VNKMDLVGYSEEVFAQVREQYTALAAKLGIASMEIVPVSALAGDNVVDASTNMPWYTGPTLLEYLETVPLHTRDARTEPLRFPVQLVVRPDANFRGFAGRVERGEVLAGQTVKALPSGRTTRVKSIVTYDGELKAAAFPRSVSLELEDEIDLSRGEILVAEEQASPNVSTAFRAMLVWMHEAPLAVGKTYLAKHTTRTVRATVRAIRYRVDVNTAEHVEAQELKMNDIAEVEFDTSLPLFFDSYAESRGMGSLILIDPISNATVGAAMIVAATAESGEAKTSKFIRYTTLQGTGSTPAQLADRLTERIGRVSNFLSGISAEEAARIPAPGKWSLQQVVGHLCDSAMNNQQRVVRLQLEPELALPAYEQEGWVRVQRYDLLPWAEEIALWLVLNRHLAHTIRHMDARALEHVWRFEGEALTLGWILEDYLAHLDHHLKALGVELA